MGVACRILAERPTDPCGDATGLASEQLQVGMRSARIAILQVLSWGCPLSARWVDVNDRMQRGYRYLLSAPVGRNFHPDFEPELTPKEMLHLGVFGGKYMTDTVDEFPKSWFSGAKLSPRGRDLSLNYFGVDASQSLSVWREKGWIYPDDPRGWFQWYCRYYLGRRLPEEDIRQIRRWKAMRRHIAQICISLHLI